MFAENDVPADAARREGSETSAHLIFSLAPVNRTGSAHFITPGFLGQLPCVHQTGLAYGPKAVPGGPPAPPRGL